MVEKLSTWRRATSQLCSTRTRTVPAAPPVYVSTRMSVAPYMPINMSAKLPKMMALDKDWLPFVRFLGTALVTWAA